MPRRSLHEDALLTAGLALDGEMGRWGVADLVERAELYAEDAIPAHVASRALRKFRRFNWVAGHPDPDTSMGPRFLYEFTDDGRVEGLAAAGRELAAGHRYPLWALRHLTPPPLAPG